MSVISYVSDMWALASTGHRQGVFFFAAMYACLACSYSTFYQLRIVRWPSARGKLLDAKLTIFGAADPLLANRDYKATTLYEYSVDGNTFEGSRLSSWLILASHNARFVLEVQLKQVESFDDGSVTVHFNPKNPEKSFLIKPGIIGLLLTSTIAIGFPILYAVDYHF